MSSIGDRYSFLSLMHTCVTSVAHFLSGLFVLKSRQRTLGGCLAYLAFVGVVVTLHRLGL